MPHDPGALRRCQGRHLVAGLLRAGCHVRVRVLGSSMWPALAPGSEVELAPMTATPRVGDVVFVDPPVTGQRLHRVVRLGPAGRVQTRGDACWRLDDACEGAAVVGVLSRVRGKRGRWRPCVPWPGRRVLVQALLGWSWLRYRLHAMSRGPAGRCRRRVSS